MNKFWLFASFFSAAFFGLFLSVWLDLRSLSLNLPVYSQPSPWAVQSIDTMKYSRDLAREKKNDPEFDRVIDETMRIIASAGATHAAIGTPYDEEFFPVLERWVAAARRYGLLVWFRGNWSGWENWFEYPRLGPAEHIALTESFITGHPEIFSDGDIFTACPECENGGPGDPRETGAAEEFKNFLIDEYDACRRAFSGINKRVICNFISLNGDVARLIMDKETTARLGGVITVDHYVRTAAEFSADVGDFLRRSGGRIVLGELGAPIPGISGEMTGTEQAEWLEAVLEELSRHNGVIGLNYWLGVGGSSELWSGSGARRPAFYVLQDYYQSRLISGMVSDRTGRPVDRVNLAFNGREFFSGRDGFFTLRAKTGESGEISLAAPGYNEHRVFWSGEEKFLRVELDKTDPDIRYKFNKLRRSLTNFILNTAG